jgi:glycosyltransferase involved in cell wall biosynthesis
MNIAIFDIQHFEMVHVLHHVFDAPSNNITFLTNKSIFSKLKNSSLGDKAYTAIVKEDYPSTSEFLSSCYKHIETNKIDAVIFNTIDEDYREVWRFIKKLNIPFFITVHNVNTWLNPPITFNLHALKNYYHRKKILQKSRGLIVQEELFIDYIQQNKLYTKPITAVPHTLNEKQITAHKNNFLRIAIPGAIDGNNRRDYTFCLSAIEKIGKKNPEITFVFIGQIYYQEGESVYAKIVALQNKGYNILHKFDITSNKLFDNEMEQCDIVFMPVKVNTKYEGIPEIYGQTKVTGVLYDMMRFQKPGIIPIEHVVPPTMKSSVLTYSSEDEFVNKILELDKNKSTINDLLKNAIENSQYYSKESIKSRFLPWYKKVIS